MAKAILKLVGVVFDHEDKPVKVLQTFTMAAHGQAWSEPQEAALVGDEYPAPTDNMFYRFKRGPLGQDGPNQVDGVLLKEDKIVMRTDSVVVEALLGRADALDGYAMEIQEAAARAKTLENDRQTIAHEILEKIQDSMEKAKAFAAMFNVQKEKE